MKQAMDIAQSAGRYCVVSASTVWQHNRMDAGFHMAIKSVEASYRYIQATISREEAVRRLWRMDYRDKQCLRVLDTGGHDRWNAVRLMMVQDRYPHLALALVKSELPELIQGAEQRVELAKEKLKHLIELNRQLNP